MNKEDKMLSVAELEQKNIIANSPLSEADLRKAEQILLNIHDKTAEGIKKGKGPFYAEIYDAEGNLVVAASNSVVEDNCALYHAEVNTLRLAHQKFGEYDLSKHNLTIYVNAEPCVMCTGAIMWSGVKTVFYSVPSKDVEQITGFDEGYKPDWVNEFKKRGIKVYGNIESAKGCQVLEDYVKEGNKIYKPER